MQSQDFEAEKKPTDRLDEIKYLLRCGELSYEEAVEEAKPPLAELNKQMRRITRMYGFKPKKVTFAQYMR